MIRDPKYPGEGRLAFAFVAAIAIALLVGCNRTEPWSTTATVPDGFAEPVIENDVGVRMRDGVLLRADIFRPAGDGPFPVLVYRTPYGKRAAAESYDTHLSAVQRGYAVVLQDVRGRYSSDGEFDPYRNEGRDGYDTIEWAALQDWSDGSVGTYGLSYPGAVQWLAAMESPPHLVAMAPAMTFASPRQFFYANGLFDLSWLSWIFQNVAPDRRLRQGLPGITTAEEAQRVWPEVAPQYLSWLPLRDLPYLRKEAPFYFEWLKHPPEDPWWDWAELRGRYGRVDAAVLNLSGWFDESYGPDGAVTNFTGLQAARNEDRNEDSHKAQRERNEDSHNEDSHLRAHLILGPWTHGVHATMSRRAGDLDFGPAAPIDYDSVILDFFDRYLRGIRNSYATEPSVQFFIMGENRWRKASRWPPDGVSYRAIYLGATQEQKLRLSWEPGAGDFTSSAFIADPQNPVLDLHESFGAHDYRQLANRSDLLTFDSARLKEPVTIAGSITAVIYAACDCRDFDLWVRVQDVWPDGRAMNIMSPGNDVLRASYRRPEEPRTLLEPGEVYELRLPDLITGIRLSRGHRLRIQISASFAPHFAPNPQTGESEVRSAESRPATITIRHDSEYLSRLLIPILPETP